MRPRSRKQRLAALRGIGLEERHRACVQQSCENSQTPERATVSFFGDSLLFVEVIKLFMGVTRLLRDRKAALQAVAGLPVLRTTRAATERAGVSPYVHAYVEAEPMQLELENTRKRKKDQRSKKLASPRRG